MDHFATVGKIIDNLDMTRIDIKEGSQVTFEILPPCFMMNSDLSNFDDVIVSLSLEPIEFTSQNLSLSTQVQVKSICLL